MSSLLVKAEVTLQVLSYDCSAKDERVANPTSTNDAILCPQLITPCRLASTELKLFSKTKSKTQQTSTSKKWFRWEDLPFEIRDLIFDWVNTQCSDYQDYFRHSTYDGMPPLVVAFRNLPRSYQHVLEWFRKGNQPFNMNGNVGYKFSGLIRQEILALDKLDILLNDYGRKRIPKKARLISRPLSIYEDFATPFLDATSVRSVDIRLRVNKNYSKDMVRFITEFPFWLRGFQNLTKVRVEIPFVPWHVNGRVRDSVLRALVKDMAKKLGVMGVVSKNIIGGVVHEVSGGEEVHVIGNWDSEVWEWKAGEGKAMDWSQDLGWRWPF